MENIVFRVEENLIGKNKAQCLSISPKDSTNHNSEAYTYELNSILSNKVWSFAIISTSGNVPVESLERLKSLITRSQTVNAAVIWESPSIVILSKLAWDSLGPFVSKPQITEIWKDFIFRGTKLRLFHIFEFNKHPEVKSVRESKSNTQELTFTSPSNSVSTPSSFKALDTTLNFKEDFEESFISKPSQDYLPSEIELTTKIETAVTELQKDNNQFALCLINEVIPYRENMHALYYAKAVAEARLGLKDEALKSLSTLLSKDPSNEKGRHLLKQIQANS